MTNIRRINKRIELITDAVRIWKPVNVGSRLCKFWLIDRIVNVSKKREFCFGSRERTSSYSVCFLSSWHVIHYSLRVPLAWLDEMHPGRSVPVSYLLIGLSIL